MRIVCVVGMIFLTGVPFLGWAQRVDYSDIRGGGNGQQLLFAGAAGNHFWIEKDNFSRSRPQDRDRELPGRRFLVLNERLQQEYEIEAPSVSYEKIYLVAGPEYFDQLSLRREDGKTLLDLARYAADGSAAEVTRHLDSLNYSASPGQILLCRSADRSRILLMAFENLPDETSRVHTLLFDRNWRLLHRDHFINPGFSQPCIQDDKIGLPGENFDNLPLKAGNGGDWVMTSVSTRNGHFLLVHGCAEAGTVSMSEIPLNPYFQLEDVAMNLDEEQGICSVGLLSRYRRTTLKDARVRRYNLNEDHFLFDSAFQFNSLVARLYNTNLVNESFIGIPGGGFMLFKEYGRTGLVPTETLNHVREEDPTPGDPVFFPALFSGGSPAPPGLKVNSYLKKSGLQGMRSEFGRGNLSMFYFPSYSGDSTWSGLINTFQITELNKPSLSYLIFSHKSSIYILYQAGEYGFTEPGVTTTLDHKGKETGDRVIFWKLNRDLDFQNATRISADQIAVPFTNKGLPGFAVIRLDR